MEKMYSTNTRNIERINNFFARAGYLPQYEKETEPAAIGGGQEVVKFRVQGFDPHKLEERLVKEWLDLPLEIV